MYMMCILAHTLTSFVCNVSTINAVHVTNNTPFAPMIFTLSLALDVFVDIPFYFSFIAHSEGRHSTHTHIHWRMILFVNIKLLRWQDSDFLIVFHEWKSGNDVAALKMWMLTNANQFLFRMLNKSKAYQYNSHTHIKIVGEMRAKMIILSDEKALREKQRDTHEKKATTTTTEWNQLYLPSSIKPKKKAISQ